MEKIYCHQASDFIVIAWQFSATTTPPSNTRKTPSFRTFLQNELIKITNNPSCQLYFNNHNKPLIKDILYKSISISHTREVLTIQLRKDLFAGIDIEAPRNQLLKIQQKFLNEEEMKLAQNSLSMLCLFWTIKEALFKIHGTSDISLKHHIHIINVYLPYVDANLILPTHTETYTLYTSSLTSFAYTITYVVKKN